MMEIGDNYCVYIHRNIINNKAYIGITAYGDDPNRRWQNSQVRIQKLAGAKNVIKNITKHRNLLLVEMAKTMYTIQNE